MSDSGHRWWDDAACANVPDRDDFFSKDPTLVNLVKRTYCDNCPVIGSCLKDAMFWETPGHRAGVWGGLTALERQRLYERRRARRRSLSA